METRIYGKTINIKEQTIKDLVTGLTIIFKVVGSGEGRMYLKGSSLLFGNRDFQFSPEGELVGTCTCTKDCGATGYSEEIRICDEG